MIGKSILHYRITGKLGAGGMGEVYLAHDERLDREVALKFLPAHVQSDASARERFLREAQAASKLTHANIVGLYYIEKAEDRDFIVMEYVRGRSLRDVINIGDHSLSQALTIARDVAGALAAAHAKGIVHRDIKAENIVLTENGQAKVLDFGLAKVEGATQITDTTSTVGTVAYMSPEQTRGEEVDARTDLFSMGVLIYEMVTGRQPFRGEHRAAVAYAIINETPEPLARYKADVPDELQRIVDKALRKDRETRYQSAADLAADLDALRNQMASSSTMPSMPSAGGSGRAVTAGTGQPRWMRYAGITAIVLLVVVAGFLLSQRMSGGDQSAMPTPPSPTAAGDQDERTMIAVLPFENMGHADDEYFADGITEEITARLARIEALGVIARTSVLRYKNTELPIGQIGEELGVDYILEGTVRWQHAEGEQARVRVTPQLIKVSDATHVWADVFDEPLTAVFEVQSQIAGQVIDELNITLVGAGAEVSRTEPPTTNMDAYDAYLRGINMVFNAATAGLPSAEAEFKHALALDPDFAEAHAAISLVKSSLYWYGSHDEEQRKQSLESARRALELKPNNGSARYSMGMYYYHCELDYDSALEQFAVALRIRPNDSETIAAIGYVNRRKGNWDTAVEYLKKASRLDPRFYQYYYELGETLADLRRFDEAGWYIDQAIELNPEADIFSWKIILEMMRGDVDAARRAAEACPDPPQEWWVTMVNAWVDICARDYETALSGLKAATFEEMDDHFTYAPRTLYIADVYWCMGRIEEARIYADSARVLAEARIAAAPDDSRLYGALGHIQAILGEKDKALASARKAMEMMPVSKEAKQGPWRIRDLVTVCIIVGEYDEAIDKIEYLLSIPAGNLTVPYMKIDPTLDPLRDHPRFKEIVARG